MASQSPQELLALLQAIEDSDAEPAEKKAAQDWTDALTKITGFLEDRKHPVVFIGNVGRGKSSLIGVAAGLVVGAPPQDKSGLKRHLVLATGGGRTTVCEVQVRARHDDEAGKGQLGLLIDPLSPEEMEREIRLYAQEEWSRHHPGSEVVDDEDPMPAAQEVHRFIRQMTGYAEYSESRNQGGRRIRQTVRPLDRVIGQYGGPDALAEHLIERAALDLRTRSEWWWPDANEVCKGKLKDVFAAINQGTEPTAMLPRRMHVAVPALLQTGEFEPTLVDTRGLDESLDSRADLQAFLRDPRALIVLCSSFRDAPEDRIRRLLHGLADDAGLRDAGHRLLLLLVDMGDADQVNGAEGDREAGQALKIDECIRVLERLPEPGGQLSLDQVIAFDVLKDDRETLIGALRSGIARLREHEQGNLNALCRHVSQFLQSMGDSLRPRMRKQVDTEIVQALSANILPEPPLPDTLGGALQAIDETRYASVVYATCRRAGTYVGLDLYEAERSVARRAATAWLDPPTKAAIQRLKQLRNDATYNAVGDYIDLTIQRLHDARIAVIEDYGDRVHEELERTLYKDSVWDACRDEWGRGRGFKQRVRDLLEVWARRADLKAHLSTSAADRMPFWREVARPVAAPDFTLGVRNVRVLRELRWRPTPISLLIGANGAGKTTVLQVLKLLRLAYDRGLDDAVTTVLGGSANLRSWGADPDLPIEVGLDVGAVHWRVVLVPRAGSVEPQAAEWLSDGEREVFRRDSLGGFLFGTDRIEPAPLLGVRILMERGVHDPAVRSVAGLLQRIEVYHDPDLWTLRWQGSDRSDDRRLQARGANAITMLRAWHQDRRRQARLQFVLDGLNDAFPNMISALDFQEAGNTLVARFYRPGSEVPVPLSVEANGVLQLLLLLTMLGGAEEESVVAIDEPENGLHPFAVRAFLRIAERWGRQRRLTIILATHSTVLLDAVSPTPERVFVMKAESPDRAVPTPLDELCDPDWLAGFTLGDLYSQDEIGSNLDGA